MSFNLQKISVVHSDRVNHVRLIPTEFQLNQPIFLGVSERRGQKEYADSFLEKSTTPQSQTHCIVVFVCNQNQISMVGRTKIVTLRTQRICVPLSPSTLMFSRNVVVRCCCFRKMWSVRCYGYSLLLYRIFLESLLSQFKSCPHSRLGDNFELDGHGWLCWSSQQPPLKRVWQTRTHPECNTSLVWLLFTLVVRFPLVEKWTTTNQPTKKTTNQAILRLRIQGRGFPQSYVMVKTSPGLSVSDRPSLSWLRTFFVMTQDVGVALENHVSMWSTLTPTWLTMRDRLSWSLTYVLHMSVGEVTLTLVLIVNYITRLLLT
jgi:hypothetical protein